MNFHRLQTAWKLTAGVQANTPQQALRSMEFKHSGLSQLPSHAWDERFSSSAQNTPHFKYMKITVSGCVPNQKCLSSTFWCVKHVRLFLILKDVRQLVIHLKRQGKKTEQYHVVKQIATSHGFLSVSFRLGAFSFAICFEIFLKFHFQDMTLSAYLSGRNAHQPKSFLFQSAFITTSLTHSLLPLNKHTLMLWCPSVGGVTRSFNK